MEQWFDVLTNEHIGEFVLMRVEYPKKNIIVWENWNTKISYVESDNTVIVEVGDDGAIIRVDRETIKLMR